jgi:hypothetical protein
VFGFASTRRSSFVILLGLAAGFQGLPAGGFVLACGLSGGRVHLLSVSIHIQEIEHPLLCASADDSEAEPGGKPF